MNIGQAVRASRRARKLTQADVGRLAGVSRQAIVLLEGNGGRVATLLAVHDHAPIRLDGLQPGKTFGDRLRAARGNKSIDAVAAAAQVSPNTIRSLEQNRGTVRLLARVIEALAPNASVAPVFDRTRSFPTVGGRRSPNRTLQDYYATPAPIVRILLDHESFEGSILEPAVGEARVVERVLHERGYTDVTCFDLVGDGHERRDFFDVHEPFDSIITNPPFSRHVEFIIHAKRIARAKIALLLPLNYLTGHQRQREVWDDRQFPLARVHVLNRGVNFLAADPFADQILPSQLYLAWYIWDRSHLGPPTITWLDSHALIGRRSADAE